MVALGEQGDAIDVRPSSIVQLSPKKVAPAIELDADARNERPGMKIEMDLDETEAAADRTREDLAKANSLS